MATSEGLVCLVLLPTRVPPALRSSGHVVELFPQSWFLRSHLSLGSLGHSEEPPSSLARRSDQPPSLPPTTRALCSPAERPAVSLNFPNPARSRLGQPTAALWAAVCGAGRGGGLPAGTRLETQCGPSLIGGALARGAGRPFCRVSFSLPRAGPQGRSRTQRCPLPAPLPGRPLLWVGGAPLPVPSCRCPAELHKGLPGVQSDLSWGLRGAWLALPVASTPVRKPVG